MGVGLRQWWRFLEGMGLATADKSAAKKEEPKTEASRPAEAFGPMEPGSVRQDAVDLRLLHPDWRYEEFQPAIEQRHGKLDRGALPDLWQWAGEQAKRPPAAPPAVEEYGEATKFPLGRRGWAMRTLSGDPSLIMDFGRFQNRFGKTFGESSVAATPERKLADLWKWAGDVTRTQLQAAGAEEPARTPAPEEPPKPIGVPEPEPPKPEPAPAPVPGPKEPGRVPSPHEPGKPIDVPVPEPPKTGPIPSEPTIMKPPPPGQQEDKEAAPDQPSRPSVHKAENDLAPLNPEFRAKLRELIAAMQRRGFDPVVSPPPPTQEAQGSPSGQGQAQEAGKPTVAWTDHIDHQDSIAADVMPKSAGRNDPEFFAALKAEAIKLGLRDAAGGQDFSLEGGRVQYAPTAGARGQGPGAGTAGTAPAASRGSELGGGGAGTAGAHAAGRPTAWLVPPPTEPPRGPMQVELTAAARGRGAAPAAEKPAKRGARKAAKPAHGQRPKPSLTDPLEPAVEQYRAKVAKYFPPEQVNNALHVMQGESHGDARAHNFSRVTHDDSWGLFQINRWGANAKTTPPPAQLIDPDFNIKYAAQMWRERGWQPWGAARALGLVPPAQPKARQKKK